MTVEKFVKEYELVSNKDKYIENHIKTGYISVLDKMADCERIVKSTMFIEEEDGTRFHRSSCLQFIFFNLLVVSRYTDLDVDFSDISSEFDLLDSQDLVNKIIEKIPSHEYSTYKNFLALHVGDVYENSRSIQSYLDDFVNLLNREVPENG